MSDTIPKAVLVGISTKMLDEIVRHRIALQRAARGLARKAVDSLAREDRRVLKAIRDAWPALATVGLAALLAQVAPMRRRSFEVARAAIATDLEALARIERAVLDRIVARAIGAPTAGVFTGVATDALVHAIENVGFAGELENGVARTLRGWIATIAERDRARLVRTLSLAAAQHDPLEVLLSRLAGTREARFADGVLAVSRRQLDSLVRTASVHVANAAPVEWALANPDAVVGLQQVEILDDVTCKTCERRNGRVWPADQAYRVPVHHLCRGALVPVLAIQVIAERLAANDDARAAA